MVNCSSCFMCKDFRRSVTRWPCCVLSQDWKPSNEDKRLFGFQTGLVCFCFTGYIQACRGLMIAAICLGLFGSVLALVGMKCTKVGGSDENKARITCFAGVDFILCGKCTWSVWAANIFSKPFNCLFLLLLRHLLTFCLFSLCTPDNNWVFWPNVYVSEVSFILKDIYVFFNWDACGI